MAKKGKNKRRTSQDFEEEEYGYEPTLSQEAKRGIVGVTFIALAAISILSMFGLAGKLGVGLHEILGVGFGITKWIVPVTLITVSYFILAKEEESQLNILGYVGMVLLILSLNGLIHVIAIPQNTAWTSAELTSAGGYAGLALGIPLLTMTGKVASIIILIALLVISLLVILNTSLQQLGRKSFFWLNWIPKFKFLRDYFSAEEKHYEDEYLEAAPTHGEKENEKPDEEEEGEVASSFQKKSLKSTSNDSKHEPVRTALMSKRRSKKVDLPLDLLSVNKGKPTGGDIKANSTKIKKAFENFDIEVEMGEINIGPTVTQYTIRPADGIKLARIRALNDDLALALAAHPIRMETPIPGKSLVGIEVPNQVTAKVGLKELIESPIFKKLENNLMIALGKDVSGEAWFADLSKMPHLLIAGATGSGKTICINSIIISLLYQNGPEDLKFIMVDPKRVELPLYNGIPHLITPVITDVKKTVNSLRWCIAEMDRRFEVLSKYRKRDIGSFNETASEKMPYLVVIIDELADLMASSPQDVEAAIIRLSQMARAVGIHLVLATQRPSVDVITGLIKANITSRIAFSVASIMDSRTILDSSGAEKLLGRGDMLFISSQMSKPKRIQGAFVSDTDTKNVADYLKDQFDDPEYDESIVEQQGGGKTFFRGTEEAEDSLYEEAKKIVMESKKASASLLQRRLKVGYARAARLIDMLEEKGIVGPADGAKPREILIDPFLEDDTAEEEVGDEEGDDDDEFEEDPLETEEDEGDVSENEEPEYEEDVDQEAFEEDDPDEEHKNDTRK